MAKEIERKFLVKNTNWKLNNQAVLIRQGYLFTSENLAFRVRTHANKALINLKSSYNGITRLEYEYPIPLSDAEEMLEKICIQPIIVKYRYTIEVMGKIWEIDEFLAENKGLIVAEIELKDENEEFFKPDWLGKEVTFDKRYYNSNLATHPYKNW